MSATLTEAEANILNLLRDGGTIYSERGEFVLYKKSVGIVRPDVKTIRDFLRRGILEKGQATRSKVLSAHGRELLDAHNFTGRMTAPTGFEMERNDMDPNMVLKTYLDACDRFHQTTEADKEERRELRECAHDALVKLLNWHHRGGFPPKDPRTHNRLEI